MNTPTRPLPDSKSVDSRRGAEPQASRQTSSRVLALGALSLLGTVAAIAFSLWRSHVQVTDLGRQTVENLARVIGEQNSRMIQSGDLILSAVLDKMGDTPLGAPARDAQINAFLRKEVAASKFLRALWMRDENGDIVYDSDAFPAVKNRKTPDYFVALRDFPDRGVVISAPTAAFRGKVVSVLSRRVSKPDGSFGGVISGAIDPKFFRATHNSIDIGPHGMIAMLFDDGTLAALSPEAPAMIGRSFASEPPFRRMRNGGHHGAFRAANFFDTTARIYSFQRVAHSPLTVVIGWSEDDLFADWRSTANTGVIVALVFWLSVAGLTYFTLHQTTRLQESEEIFETAFRSSPVAIALVTLDGRYVEVNPEWTSMMGYSREEMIGQTAVGMSLITPAERERALLEVERGGKAGEPLETKARRRDGSFLDVLVTHATVTLRGVPHRLVTTFDITVRKQAEASRFEREQEFEALVENAPDIVSRFDREFRHLYVNRAVTRATGLPASAFIGKTHEELGMPPHLQVDWHNVLEDVFVSGEEREMEYELPSPGGPRFYQSRLVPEQTADGRIAYVLNIARDITERKQAEAAMRQSERRLQFVLEASGIGYWDLDTVSNQTWRSLRHDECFGYTEMLPGWNYETFISHVHPGDRERVKHAFEDASAGRGEYNVEFRTVWPDQSVHWLLTIGRFVRDGTGQTIRVLGVVLDVSERKRTEEALQESEERFAKAFQSGPIGLVMIRTSDRRIVEVNESFERLTGYTRAECLGLTSRELGFLSAEEIEKQSGALDEQGALRNVEILFRDKAGNQRTVLMSVENLTLRGESHSIASVLDITVRKAAEVARNAAELEVKQLNADLEQRVIERTQELQDSEQLFAVAVEAAHAGIWDWDMTSGKLNWSPALFRIFGLDPETAEASFEFWRAVVHPDDIAIAEKRITDAIEQHTRLNSEYRIVLAPDDLRWVTALGDTTYDGEGKPQRMSGVILDITERKRAELNLASLAAELRAANKELEAFSYSVSHDLRAPLRGVDGYVAMLMEDQADRLDAEGNRMLGVVSSEARRMGQLIDDLLAFSRLGRQKMATQVVDMTSLARVELEYLTGEAPGSAPQFELHPLPQAVGDPAMLRQVFANLLANAVKFSHKSANPVIEIGAETGDGEATFYVKDNGVGFDERYRDKLFGVFQRLHSEAEFEGTGVGLALVQRVIVRHGGKVWAESKPGDGATFYFSLPVTTRIRQE